MFFANTLLNIAKIIQEQIEHEQTDVKSIQTQLLNLQLDLEMGKISETDYDEKEQILLKQLSQAQKKQKEKEDVD
jgi:hypothetical protein